MDADSARGDNFQARKAENRRVPFGERERQTGSGGEREGQEREREERWYIPLVLCSPCTIEKPVTGFDVCICGTEAKAKAAKEEKQRQLDKERRRREREIRELERKLAVYGGAAHNLFCVAAVVLYSRA